MKNYRIESLERRRLLAAVSWDGGGDGTNWTDPLNWSNDALPTSLDDVTIDPNTPTGEVILAGSSTVRSLLTNQFFVSS